MLHILVYRSIRGQGLAQLPLNTFASGALSLMIFISAGIIFLLGVSVIKRGIQRDFTTDMITSHRTTAMTGNAAVLGYLTGPTAQTLALTLVNWLACTILAVLAGYPVYAPTVVLAVFLCLALMLWTFAILVGLSTRGSTSIAGLVILLAILASTDVVSLLPGLSLLIGHATAAALPGTAATGLADASVFISMLGQLALALTFFAAAARKFSRDDVPAFNPLLAYILLALCTLLAAVAMRYWPTSSVSSIPTPFTANVAHKAIASLAGTALVALLPVACAARRTAMWAKRRARDAGYAGPKPRAFWVAPFLATAIVYGIFAAANAAEIRAVAASDEISVFLSHTGWTALFFSSSLLTAAGLLRYTYSRTHKAMWILVIYLGLSWAIPLVADLSLDVVYIREAGEPRSALLACSPIGGWIVAFGAADAPLAPGMLFQVLLAAGSLWLARRARHRT
jgi:hypothetical protein